MRWRRIAKLSVILGLLLVAVAGSPLALDFIKIELRNYAERPSPIVATPDETRSILSAVLEQKKLEGVPPPPPEPGEVRAPKPRQVLILLDRSVCFSKDPNKVGCEPFLADDLIDPRLVAFAPEKLRRELGLANQEPHDLNLENIPFTKVVSAADIIGIFSKGGWWTDFYARYPGTSGFAAISRPVLTPDRKEALVYIAHHCDGLCGTGTIVLLERAGSVWRVAKEEMLWIS